MIPRDPEETNGRDDPEIAETEAPEEVQETLAAEKQKAAEYLASWQRAQADFMNYKRRSEQERADFNAFANANLVQALLPVVDDLERAIDSVPTRLAKDEWAEGVRLVEKKFKTILEGQGVRPINPLGEHFDPKFHEALRQDKGPEGIVTAVFQKGYLMHDKLLRPARVVVGNGEGDELETPES